MALTLPDIVHSIWCLHRLCSVDIGAVGSAKSLKRVSLLASGICVLVGNEHASLISAWIYGFLGVTLGDLIAWYFWT